ncbi:Uncharacterised protein [Providencia rettgeri]|uniref:Uncharacterized protein n=1 Tax=Providencia rettgeri TaxID=587 RepID=A0A2X2DR55_PRORE|nr:hypothetical protein [Providencia rettgeri]CAB5559075.1 Uncharacterised protein [Providencia rettgeri]CAB5655631.1 Uncharacterised protein [Providencia rettgeri]CAB5662271.1 Uncharacterised protein [Providencia rettgeri]CAC9150803.1 Uncharacterised protein [Providencia rettgeri]
MRNAIYPTRNKRSKLFYAPTERHTYWLNLANDTTHCIYVFVILVDNSTIIAARLPIKG